MGAAPFGPKGAGVGARLRMDVRNPLRRLADATTAAAARAAAVGD